MSDKPSNSEKLVQLVGFDPTRKPTLKDSILKDVIGELDKERQDEARAKAREILRKAVELHQQVHKLKQEFEKQTRKFDEELGKLLNQLRVSDDVPQPQAEVEQLEAKQE